MITTTMQLVQVDELRSEAKKMNKQINYSTTIINITTIAVTEKNTITTANK